MAHPKSVGDQSTLAIMTALHGAGYSLYLPFGENTRSDLGIEVGSRLMRVQCKTGRLRLGAIRFRVCSFYYHHPNPHKPSRDYLEDVDFFAVYCPETSGVYLVPIGELRLRSQAALRVDAPRNNQRRRVRFAADYLVGRVSVKAPATGGLAGNAGA